MSVIDRPRQAPPSPPEPPEGRPRAAVRAWRRPPVLPILVIWAVMTALLVWFALVVPDRLLGMAASPTMVEVKATFKVFTLASAPVAAMVWSIMVYSIVKWRYRGDGPPPDTAPAMRENPRLQVIWLVVSSLLCLFLLVWGLVVLQPPGSEVNASTPPLVVNVTGQQWVWSFDYPTDTGWLAGTPAAANHLAIHQSTDLYLPVNQRVLFRITSKDVVHSFWIVQMATKVDANPGATTTASVTPDVIGTFTIRCAELCGLYHSEMQTTVHVVSQADFQTWLQQNGRIA
jgi:cytochrome c oxidase subunit 2